MAVTLTQCDRWRVMMNNYDLNTENGRLCDLIDKQKSEIKSLKGENRTIRSDRNAFIIVSGIFALLSLTLVAANLGWI